jgi:hypothetical protein
MDDFVVGFELGDDEEAGCLCAAGSLEDAEAKDCLPESEEEHHRTQFVAMKNEPPTSKQVEQAAQQHHGSSEDKVQFRVVRLHRLHATREAA